MVKEQAVDRARAAGRELRSLWNRGKARLGVGDYWSWLDPSEMPAEIPIAPLVSPLRYDILIRRNFFETYASERERFRSAPEAFLEVARSHDYYQWFTQVRIPHVHGPGSLAPAEIEERFAERVQRSTRLYERIEESGFDPESPIEPITGLEILSTRTGLRTGQRFYMGDGCHRLACLMARGHTVLPRAFVRVRCQRRLIPLDITARLRPHVEIRWPDEMAALAAESRLTDA